MKAQWYIAKPYKKPYPVIQDVVRFWKLSKILTATIFQCQLHRCIYSFVKAKHSGAKL